MDHLVAALAQEAPTGTPLSIGAIDGFVDGLTGFAVPNHGGFALVGDAHSAHLACVNPRFLQGLASGRQLGVPNFQGIMLHPTRLGIKLGQFLLRHGHDAAVGVEHDAAGAGSALVKGEQVGHGCAFCR